MVHMMTKETNILCNAIRYQLANPRRSGVNCESRFVVDTIAKVDPGLAKRYWKWVCHCSNEDFGPEVKELQDKLEVLEQSTTPLPDWSTYGT